MTCKKARSLLSAYIDRELVGSEMIGVRAHLSQCLGCAREAEELRSFKLILVELPEVEPPFDLEAKLLCRLAAEAEPAERAVATLKLPVLSGLCAAACLATLLFLSTRPIDGGSVVTQPRRDPISFEIGRDQAYVTSSDPLGASVLPTSYETRR